MDISKCLRKNYFDTDGAPYDLSEDEDGFYLGLKSRHNGVCVTVPDLMHMYSLTIATVVPQIFNYVLMNIIISTHNDL